jgi:hypothetical protein
MFQIEIIAHKTMLNFRLIFDEKEYDSVKANYGPNIPLVKNSYIS